MTKQEAKELLPIIQAFVAGKQIQDAIEGLTDWCDTDEINLEFNGQKIIHRIKPELKYRPFKNQEECWNEMMKHQPFGWLTNKANNRKYLITALTNGYASVNSFPGMSFDSYFNEFTFVDGSPFGMKKKEA